MRDEDKPFVCVRGGMSFNITPRNATGWLYTAMWLAPALVLGLAFAWIMDGDPGEPRDTVLAVVGFILLMTVWAVAMVRWMYVRSHVIDVRNPGEGKRKDDRRKP